MKRTELRRGAPIARTGSLFRSTPLERGGPLAHHGARLRGTRLRRVGKRGERDADALRNFREVVIARAGGRCERCGKRRELVAHHLATRARCPGHPLLHHPSNGKACCIPCHQSIHSGTAHDAAAWLLKTPAPLSELVSAPAAASEAEGVAV